METEPSNYQHIFVVKGEVELLGDVLSEGDAARLTDAGAVQITGREPAEVLVWEMDRSVRTEPRWR